MVARRQDSKQIVALFFIALLAGYDCGRISEHTSLASNLQEHLQQDIAFRQKEMTNSPFFWFHNDVCRPLELKSKDTTAASNRYIKKVERILKITHDLKEGKCVQGCPAKWVEMKSRLSHFASCNEINETGKQKLNHDSVTQLKKALGEKGHELTKVYVEALTAIGLAMKKNNMFPDGEKCSFFPSRLNMKEAFEASKHDKSGAKRIMREQMFGKECDEAGAKEYLNNLPERAKLTANATMTIVDRAVGLAQHVQSNPSPDEEDMKKEGENIAVDAKHIVQEAKADATNDAKDAHSFDNEQQLEEQTEEKEALEDDGVASDSDSSALIALRNAEMTRGDSGFTWFEFFIGVIVILLVQALIGYAGAPLNAAFQNFYYASIR